MGSQPPDRLREVAAEGVMSKPNGFIRINRNLWRSEAVENLSPRARLLLVELLYRYTGKNNGRIVMSWEDAQKALRCQRRMVAHYFAELHQAGLIETVVSGSFDHKQGARKGMGSQYSLAGVKEI